MTKSVDDLSDELEKIKKKLREMWDYAEKMVVHDESAITPEVMPHEFLDKFERLFTKELND